MRIKKYNKIMNNKMNGKQIQMNPTINKILIIYKFYCVN